MQASELEDIRTVMVHMFSLTIDQTLMGLNPITILLGGTITRIPAKKAIIAGKLLSNR